MGETAEILARAVRHHARASPTASRSRASSKAAGARSPPGASRARSRRSRCRRLRAARPRPIVDGRRASARRHDDRGPAQAAAGRSAEVEGQPGIITAGSSSGITDGGAAVVLAARRSAARTRPEAAGARSSGWASAGVDPRVMGIGPVPAMQKLQRADRPRRSTTSIWSSSTKRSPPQVLAVLRDVPIASRAAERQRRRDRARPSDRLHRRAHRRHAAARAAAPRRRPRPRDAVRQRRHGHGAGDRALSTERTIADPSTEFRRLAVT